MKSSTRTLMISVFLLLGLVLGLGIGAAGALKRPYASTVEWQSLGAPPGGAEAILETYASQYSGEGWQVYVRSGDGRIYLNDNGAGWVESAAVAPPSGAEDCGSTMFTPPALPDLAVEARYVSVCHAEIIEQYGFARLSDGTVWRWSDAYTGMYALGKLAARGLCGGGAGCLAGLLLALMILGLAAKSKAKNR